ncbi:unnamed protein product [Dovyalis caffra]|uniref:Bet v I/Major latex protein domain-containing protein n=1 Tax=Dovyalis caffra TaxID=77055 RepID=A0AAV1RZN4_9ROSI|nr:unnamed protein product [Dovyalis caffra]
MHTRVAETSLQCSADLFFKFFKETACRLPEVCGDIVQKIELADRNTSWIDVVGSRKRIYFTPSPGASENVKYEVEGIDDSSKKISYNVLEGSMLQLYKTFKVTFEVTVFEVTAASTAKWTIIYDKLDPSYKDPDVYIGLLLTVNNEVNNCLRYCCEV